MMNLIQLKKALEEHFEDVFFVGYVFCVKHVHDGRFNQAYSEFVGELRLLTGLKIELFIYDPRRLQVVFFGCEAHAKDVSSIVSRRWIHLAWEDCPLEPLYCAVDYFVNDQVFKGWKHYLSVITDKPGV